MTAKGRRPIDYFRFFYNDTAVGGAGSAIRCGLDFFSAAYYSPPAVRSIPKAVRCSSATPSLRSTPCLDEEECGNALSMLKMTVE